MTWMQRLVAVAAVGVATAAAANERHFGFTYETAVLPPGEREVEVWITPRVGREEHYLRFDNRVEFEVGLMDRLMTAFYLNGNALSERVGDGLQSSFEFAGVSSEWKYKLLDPVADPLGLSIYGEVTWSPTVVELEAKLILDKRIGRVLLAANVVVEQELGLELNRVAPETDIELDLAAGYYLTDRLILGLELRNVNVVVPAGWAYSALYFGPTLAYARENWWVSLSIQPQLPALKRSAPASLLVLDDQERFNARLLFSLKI